ncbi:hypothetical protein [Hyalangium minutum]|uniref:Uncharacterized protein n=1 Tax=Hyalangium minutum TaxID=394096 RepID=A0A085WWF3_9BACT|nr:hypothetical protein [Hyalangium minutum]KFE72016.1 hypothetical protein DB31_0277 [Hyalangium minutum]
MGTDDFDGWIQSQIASLTQERDALCAKRDEARAHATPRSLTEERELVGLLGEFFRRHRCVSGTLEHIRRRRNTETVVYGIRENGDPDTFFSFKGEPFWVRIEEFLETQEGECRLELRVDLAKGMSSASFLDGESYRNWDEAAELSSGVDQLERRIKGFRGLNVSKEPFGKPLARKVAQALSRGDLCFSHRDYCGTGLFLSQSGHYLYATVEDGGPANVLREFPSIEPFVEWLAQQSDASLSRFGETDFVFLNQTLRRQRLEEFIAGQHGYRTLS